MNFEYNFLNLGSTAPERVRENEIWLDVGNRCDRQVLDHHSGDTDGWSTVDLVLKHYKEFIVSPLKDKDTIILATHSNPDLDAISSIWLTQRLLRANLDTDSIKEIQLITNAVSDNDQGYVKTDNPESSWPIVMRLLIDVELGSADDRQKIEKGIEFLDTTLEILNSGDDLAYAAQRIITSRVRLAMSQASRDYIEDLSRAVTFQIRLPVKPFDGEKTTGIETPQDPPPNNKDIRWSLADAIYIEDPASKFFKEIARGDAKHSSLKQGFSLMIVNYSQSIVNGRPLFRYIISTDPLTGLFLKGLGKILEQAEQQKENEMEMDLFQGRERVGEGKGRHGYNVISPWYDGRGHDFTIIDSPSVEVQGKKLVASILNPNEILNIIWEYGDPAKYITSLESEITLICKASLTSEWDSNKYNKIKISDACPDISEEVKMVADKLSISSVQQMYEFKSVDFKLVEQQIWLLEADQAVWVGVFKSMKSEFNLRELARQVYIIKNSDYNNVLLPAGVILSNVNSGVHIVNSRVNPSEISIEDKEGYSALALYRVASGDRSYFFNRADDDELNSISRIYSRDHKNLLLATGNGLVVLSTRDVSFKDECDFHKPEMFRVIVNIIFALKFSLDNLSTQFSLNRSFINPIKASRRILEDRWKLIHLEQEMSFDRISEKKFAQKSFDELKKVFSIEKRYYELKQKIISLDEQIKHSSANYYQKIAFLVTTVLAPLAVTASFFSGTHMQKDFSKMYFTFLPAEWQPAGWLQFILVFLSTSFFVVLIWIIVKFLFRRKSILKQFYNKKHSGYN